MRELLMKYPRICALVIFVVCVINAMTGAILAQKHGIVIPLLSYQKGILFTFLTTTVFNFNILVLIIYFVSYNKNHIFAQMYTNLSHCFTVMMLVLAFGVSVIIAH